MQIACFLLASSLFLGSAIQAEQETCPPKQEFIINLKEPVFSHGVITTDQGGVVESEGIRIQARKIEYTNRIENGNPVQRIVAEGDLMMEYSEHAFVGERLEYDFVTKTGTLFEGKTFVDVWFLGGERIDLQCDGTYLIYNAFVTTCESQDNTWEISAGKVKITKDYLLSARNIRFRFEKFPVLWLPSFKSNLKFFKDPPIRYKLKWDKSIGPRVTMRYRVFSWEHYNLYFRLDYRLKHGFGAAIESDYYSEDGRTTFLTKSYGAHDKLVQDERGWKRYRLQGLYEKFSEDDKTHVYMSYDKFSDDKMPGDFKSNDFEVNTQERTILRIDHREYSSFGNFTFQPRVNRFQSLNQELPLINIGIRPFEIGRSGIISENRVNAGYLNYTYNSVLHEFIHDRHAVRVETKNQVYRPIPLGPVTITPRAGIDAIFYNNGPHRSSIGQGVLTYGCEANTRLYRSYDCFKHMAEPYALYQGISQPLAGINDHFIFNIDDGYARVNLIRAGVRNSLFFYDRSPFVPLFTGDVFTYLFIKDPRLPKTFAKLYTSVGMNLSSIAIKGCVGWNAEENVWDFANIRTDWTVNEDLAFGVEFRHRSRFDWRKADHENFILDFARSVSELLDSPLSDGRNTLLTRLHMRITPRISCHFQSHHGWGRKNEPGYNAMKLDLLTLLGCSWQLRLSLRYNPVGGISPTASISLVK